MALRTSFNKVRFPQWVDIMRQLRPSVTPDDVANLVPWRYKFVTSSRDDKVVGAGAYYPTASLIKGKFNYLADLVVDEKYRGHGVGASMMSEILDPNLSCELDSGLEKVDAHRFYRGLGFVHSGYAVRPQVAVLAAMGDLPQQQTYLIDGASHLQAQGEDKQMRIQAFIDEHATLNVSYQANLQLFMKGNPDHRLLALQGDAGELEGILLYELQNRLSIGGNCFHVTDLIVKDGLGAKERQNALLLSLLQQAKNCNVKDSASSIRTVIVEMTEEEAKNHKVLKGGEAEDKAVNSVTKININSFFSATAKHFIKPASATDKDQLPSGGWYQKRSARLV